jgi:hypothetical protein
MVVPLYSLDLVVPFPQRRTQVFPRPLPADAVVSAQAINAVGFAKPNDDIGALCSGQVVSSLSSHDRCRLPETRRDIGFAY